ncbi:MAG: hypothetical protein JWO38_5358 [Gemmataceae bacterium]|nr:hypothetical protein [Gemmataceae bacterium]
MTRLYCLAEDRVTEEVGLRFAVASLARACPSARAVIFRPSPAADFRAWLGRYERVKLVTETLPGGASWNCKPHALLRLLEDADEVVWVDSDMIVTRDPSYLFDRLGPGELVGTEEPPSHHNQGWALRTAGWRLAPGRDSPVTLNSSIVRVTRAHIPLLRRWGELQENPAYLAAQRAPFSERPPYFMGGQDVLNALLGSAEFAHVPVQYLRIGKEIIHCGGALGYPLGRRLGGLGRRVPPFLHAIAGKPWVVFHPHYLKTHGGWFAFNRRLLQETSPYVAAARRLRAEVGVPCPWLDVRSVPGAVLRAAGLGHFALLGLPLTAAATAVTAARKLFRSG